MPHLKIIKFLIKALILVSYCKLLKFTKNEKNEKNTFYFSLYPNKYFYGKENFFEKKKNICNFLMSDETHLNFNLRKLFHFAKETNDKKIVNIEQYIKVSDILLLMLKHLYNMFTFKNLRKMEIDLQGLDFKEVLNNIYVGSYINRSKLECILELFQDS